MPQSGTSRSNVRDSGVVGDGVERDTDAIQRTLDDGVDPTLVNCGQDRFAVPCSNEIAG